VARGGNSKHVGGSLAACMHACSADWTWTSSFLLAFIASTPRLGDQLSIVFLHHRQRVRHLQIYCMQFLQAAIESDLREPLAVRRAASFPGLAPVGSTGNC
jgi:hypothetical protein